MRTAPGNQGHKATRSKSEKDSYYKGRYYIAFYRELEDDERFYIGFNNVIEICKYLKQEVNTVNINKIHQNLYKCLYSKEIVYTKMIDDIKLRVYLIDMIDEIKENERREKFMKQFVKINSTMNIEVYPDLHVIDATNEKAPMADRLNVKPNWVFPVLIMTGIHFYPSEVKNWKAVKSLEKRSILSISEEVDEVPEDEKARCMELKKKMAKVLARTPAKKEKAKVEEPKAE